MSEMKENGALTNRRSSLGIATAALVVGVPGAAPGSATAQVGPARNCPMKSIGILLAGAFLPTMAAAQDPVPETSGWQRSWTLSAAPVFGADREVAPFPVGDEIIDESEFGAGLAFGRTFGNGASLTFTPAASYSPQSVRRRGAGVRAFLFHSPEGARHQGGEASGLAVVGPQPLRPGGL